MEDVGADPRFDELWELGAKGDRDALLATIESIVGLGTWVWELGQRRVAWSAGLYRILGYDPKTTDASVEKFFAAIHPEDVDRVRSLAERNAATGQTPTVHCRVRRANGEVRHIRLDGIAVFDENREPQRFIGTVLDTTDSCVREHELLRTAEILNEAQRTAHVGSWYFDTSTGLIEWSDELYRILGISREAEPSHRLFFDRVHPDDLERLMRARDQAFEGKFEPVELRIVPPEGGERSVVLETRLLANQHSTGQVFLGIVLDVTQRRQLEQNLRQAQKIEAIGRLAGGIAHDFNNLLAIIQGSAELLRARSGGSEVEDILQATNRGASLTRQLLSFSRRAVLHARVLDLNEQVLNATRLVRRLIGEDIRVRLELDGELWNIRADSNQLEQVVINLALNARDAMPSGGLLTLRTANVPQAFEDPIHGSHASSGDQVLLEVTDTGSGFSSEARDHLFEPFFTTKPPGHGTGLGLATVYGIVTQAGGTLAVDSEVERGTTFRLYFPRVVEKPARPTESEPATAMTGSERVLLVEDDEHVRSVIHRILSSAGYQVTQCSGPAIGAELARSAKQPFDILITDVVMPGISGRELAKQLSDDGAVASVLYVSGYAPNSPDEYLADSAYLQKPFGQKQLLSAVRSALESSRRRAAFSDADRHR